MTLQQAKSLKHGDYVHHVSAKNADGTPQRFQVQSVKTWKTRPDDVLVCAKRGLKEYVRFGNVWYSTSYRTFTLEPIEDYEPGKS